MFIREENTVNDFQLWDRVIYVPSYATKDYLEHGYHPDIEYGVVKSVNESFVFVYYVRHGILKYTTKATDPKDLIKE